MAMASWSSAANRDIPAAFPTAARRAGT